MVKPKPGKSTKGQPPKNNLKKEPKTQQEQVQAVYNDFMGEIIGMAKNIQVEQELNSKPVDRLLGVGGKDLDGYAGQLQNGFKDIDPGNSLAKKLAKEKESAPFLKKVSKEEPWADDAGKAGSQSPPKITNNKKGSGKK